MRRILRIGDEVAIAEFPETVSRTLLDAVPGEWMKTLMGASRNHFDRVVHFTFGLFPAYPQREVLMRKAGLASGWGRGACDIYDARGERGVRDYRSNSGVNCRPCQRASVGEVIAPEHPSSAFQTV